MRGASDPKAWLSVVALVVLAASRSAGAQSLEVGGTIGVGARGSESALARSEARLISAVHAGVLWANRLETALSVSWLDLPRRIGSVTYHIGCEPGIAGRCPSAGELRVLFERTSPRTFVSGRVVYHFRRDHRWRPFAGIAFGGLRDAEFRRCAIAGCEELLPGLRSVIGARASWHSDPWSPVAGVSATLGRHGIIRGAFQVHRPFGEELSLVETSVGIGYRF